MWGLVLKSGTIRSILDTDDQKSGSYRRGLVPRRKNCPCDLKMRCASADFTDGTARTSIIMHSSMPMLPSESSICHTNLGTTIYILVRFIYWSGHRLMPVIMRIMRRSGPGLIWTPCILLMTPKEYCITQIFRVEEIFAIFANLDFARNFPHAKILSTANGISRNVPPREIKILIAV